MYYVLLDHGTDRDRFIARMADEDVNVVFHYVPLHSSPAGERYGRTHGSLDVTDSVSERFVRLPLWVGMTESEIARVTSALQSALAPARV